MYAPLLFALLFLSSVLVAALTDFEPPNLLFVVMCMVFLKKPLFGFLLFAILFAFLRVWIYEKQILITPPIGEYVTLEGNVSAEPDPRADHQKITVKTEYGNVLVNASLYSEIGFGDTVKIMGILEEPYEDENFSYAKYLSRYETWLVMNSAQVEISKRADFSIRALLYDFKKVVQKRIDDLYFEPESSFVSGLLLGSRKGMSEELTEAFKKSGITHIVAVSGYNISLVIAAIFALFHFVPLKKRIIVSIIFVGLFVIFVGASAAAVRAGIMGSIAMFGLYSGRKSQAFFALLWSAVIMTMWNPYILVYDVGFQLSFASTFGLFAFMPLFERIKKFKNKIAGFLRESFLLTVSAQIAALPIMAYHFGTVSLVSPLVNVLVAPLIPLAMLFSGLSLICGMPAVLIADFHLKLIEKIAIIFAEIPYAQAELKFNASQFSLSIFLMAFFLIFSYKSTLARAFRL